MDGVHPMEAWLNICALDEIPVRGARRFMSAVGEIAVFRTGNEDIYAIENSCPHKQGPLSEGIVHDTGVTCPLHSWVIDLQTGHARGADKGCVKTFSAKVSEGRVLVKVAV